MKPTCPQPWGWESKLGLFGSGLSTGMRALMAGLDGPSVVLPASQFFEMRVVKEHWEAELLW